jgi:hypothetical protein
VLHQRYCNEFDIFVHEASIPGTGASRSRLLSKDVFAVSPLVLHLVEDGGGAAEADPAVVGDDADELVVHRAGHAHLRTTL